MPMPCFFMAPFLGTSVLQHGISADAIFISMVF